MLIKLIVGVLLLLLALLLYFVIVSTGRIREYKDDKGNQLEGSISEKIKIDINGAQNGLFINGKNLDNPVLLFVSSGPGTDDYFLNEKYPDMHIEDEFTVCYWDYRGMGIVYDYMNCLFGNPTTEKEIPFIDAAAGRVEVFAFDAC